MQKPADVREDAPAAAPKLGSLIEQLAAHGTVYLEERLRLAEDELRLALVGLRRMLVLGLAALTAATCGLTLLALGLAAFLHERGLPLSWVLVVAGVLVLGGAALLGVIADRRFTQRESLFRRSLAELENDRRFLAGRR